MKLARARPGRVEVYTSEIRNVVYRLLTQRDARRQGQEGRGEKNYGDSEVLYRETLAQQGFVNPLILYHARKYASLQQSAGVGR